MFGAATQCVLGECLIKVAVARACGSVDVVAKLGTEIGNLQPEIKEHVIGKLDGAKTALKEVDDLAKMGLDALETVLHNLQIREEQAVDFASKAEVLAMWADDSQTLLQEPVFARSVAEVEAMEAAVQSVVKAVAEQKKNVGELHEVPCNPYTDRTIASLTSQIDRVGELTEARVAALAGEKAKRMEEDGLCKQVCLWTLLKEAMAPNVAVSLPGRLHSLQKFVGM